MYCIVRGSDSGSRRESVTNSGPGRDSGCGGSGIMYNSSGIHRDNCSGSGSGGNDDSSDVTCMYPIVHTSRGPDQLRHN